MAYLAQRLTKDIHNSGLPAFMPGMGQAVPDFTWNEEGIDWERVAQKASPLRTPRENPLDGVCRSHWRAPQYGDLPENVRYAGWASVIRSSIILHGHSQRLLGSSN